MHLKYREQGVKNMKNAWKLELVCFFALLIISCDASGYLSLSNGYSQDVILYATYNYQGRIIEDLLKFSPGMVFAPAAMGHIEYNHIIAIKLKDSTGIVLTEYNPNYLIKVREAYIKAKGKNQQESWVFTEKGLFLKTHDVSRKYKFDLEKIFEYYRSDEAVRDFEAMLVKK
jgi:hypothetical protein